LKTNAFLLFFVISFNPAFSQYDNISSGRALAFDGIDDYIDLGNILDDLEFPFTISAWVFLDSASNGGPVFVSQDNSPVYNGFWFYVRQDRISIEYGDGLGENKPFFRRGKSAAIEGITNQWAHATAVVNGIDDIELYLNGTNVGGDITGESARPMASTFRRDVAKIGYFLSNGVEYHFKGALDEIRIFDRALSSEEIRHQMCRKITASTVGLIGNWRFNELNSLTIEDNSPEQNHGKLKNGPVRLFSGAPVGDESIFEYSDAWQGKTISFDNLSVTNIGGDPWGIQVYKIYSAPSRTLGIASPEAIDSYYGIFAAGNGTDQKFDVQFRNSEPCKLLKRPDNAEAQWREFGETFGVIRRIEIIELKCM
jgi:hypothetical protein